MNSVKVQFPESLTKYTYINNLPEKVDVGDVVVVDSPYKGLVTAKVVEIGVSGGTVELVDKVDSTRYEAQLQRKRAMALIKTKLDARLKKMESIIKYQMLAQVDIEAQQLLKELESMQ